MTWKVWAAAIVAGLWAACFVSACEPLFDSWDSREPVHVRKADVPVVASSTANALKVMAWNIKYAGGRQDFWFDLWGDKVQMNRAEVELHLAGLVALIKEVNPDVLMVEEIEVNSRRSAYTDMVHHILNKAGFHSAAYFSTWKSRYVASDGVGRMDMGNAIFSKHPIVKAERIALSDRTDQDPATAAFYLHRALGRVVIDVGGAQVQAFVVHTEAYDTDGTKAKQLKEVLAEFSAQQGPRVIGGDFNAIPPGSLKVFDFNDEHPTSKGTDFAQPPYALEDMVPFYSMFTPAITLQMYGTTAESQRRHFSHSVIGRDKIGALGEPGFWNRTLDYLFVDPQTTWVPDSTDTLQEPGRLGIISDPMLLSDHCPVVGTWQVLAP